MPKNHIGHQIGAAHYLFPFHIIAKIYNLSNLECKDKMVNIDFSVVLK